MREYARKDEERRMENMMTLERVLDVAFKFGRGRGWDND